MNNSGDTTKNTADPTPGGRGVTPTFRGWWVDATLLWLAAQLVFWIPAAIFADGAGGYCRFDCVWYRSVAENGYMEFPITAQYYANWPFFPLFPYVCALATKLFPVTFVQAAAVINPLATLGFALATYRFAPRSWLKNVAAKRRFLTLFLIASPYSMYLSLPYAEALFNLTLLTTVIAWAGNRFVVASAAGILLTASRPTGILLPVALAVDQAFRYRFGLLRRVKTHFGKLAATAIMPLGAVYFSFLLASAVGDPLANVHVSGQWLRGFGDTFSAGAKLWTQNPFIVLFPAAVIISAAAAAVYMLKTDLARECALLILAVIALIAVTGLHNSARYLLAMFPLYIPLASARGGIFWLICAAAIPLKIFFIHSWFYDVGAVWLIG